MSKKYLNNLIDKHGYSEIKNSFDSLINFELKEDAEFEEQTLDDYVEGLECQNEDLRNNLVKARERIAELELWIEYAVKHDLQMPEWIRNSAACLLNKQKKGDV